MPSAVLGAALALLLVDAALRLWRARGHTLHTLVYLLLAYGPLLVVPRLPPVALSAAAGLVALGGLINFVRLVGLRHDLTFAGPVWLLVPATFAVAHLGPPGLFHAMPLLAIVLVLVPSTLRGSPQAYLQKVCLSWVAFLVYGYLWGHAAFLGREQPLLVALLILLAKFADVAWVATGRFGPRAPGWQLVASPLGGLLGGLVLSLIPGLPPGPWIVLGLVAGFVLGLASRSHDLIVIDVTDGSDGGPRTTGRPLKSTMLFGFGFVLAVALQLRLWLAS